MQRNIVHKYAFTLIELLVVIAVIALLIGILLPALAAARKAGWKTVSLSNIRQITVGAYTYRDDNKGFWPITLTYQRGTAPSSSYPSPVGWATWQFGGKNNSADWVHSDRGFDIEAADRPLNAYLYPGLIFEAPSPPTWMSHVDPSRSNLQLPIYKDPSDAVSYQGSRNSFFLKPEAKYISSYDDVGTSYHFNVKWYRPASEHMPSDPLTKIFDFGCRRIREADTYQASRFVWVNDQYSDVVANNPQSDFELENGYGDANRSVMGFLDGHATYLPVRPGRVRDSYINGDYSFIFDDLKLE